MPKIHLPSITPRKNYHSPGEGGVFILLFTTILGNKDEKGKIGYEKRIIHLEIENIATVKESVTAKRNHVPQKKSDITQIGKKTIIHFSGTRINRAIASSWTASLKRIVKVTIKE